MKKLFFLIFSVSFLLEIDLQAQVVTDWQLRGNSNTLPSDFLGTTDCMPIVFMTNNTERMRLLSDKSFLGIGLTKPYATLHLHLQMDPKPCGESGYHPDRKLLQLTTPETGNAFNQGFSISSLISKEILLQQHEPANFSLKGLLGGVTIAPSGNIGIGTEQPLNKLHIKDGSILISKYKLSWVKFSQI